MNHAMTNSVDLFHAGYHAALFAGQLVDDGCNGFCMGGHGDLEFLLEVLCGDLVGQATVNTNPFAQTFCEHGVGIGVHELILQRRTASVDNEDFHVGLSFLH